MSDNNKCCGTCARFRTSDGWCRAKGKFVNALAVVEECYNTKETVWENPLHPSKDSVKINTEMRVCKICGKTKPLVDFARHGKAKDGYSHTCADCYADIMRKAGVKGGKRKKTPVPDSANSANSANFANSAHAEMTDKDLVSELRRRGWTVSCTRTVEEAL